MVESYLRQSPLDHLHLDARATAAPGEAGVIVRERKFTAKVILRGDIADEAFAKAAKRALGFVPPAQPNTVDGKRDRYALWLGPDEWLVVGAPDSQDKLVTALREALAGMTAAVTDVSEGRTVLRLTGPAARDLLAKGCGLDLHPRTFRAGCCAQSRLAKALIVLHQIDEAPSYDVYIERSFADYLWHWLEDAAEEFGLAVTAEPPAAPRPKRRPAARE